MEQYDTYHFILKGTVLEMHGFQGVQKVRGQKLGPRIFERCFRNARFLKKPPGGGGFFLKRPFIFL